MLSLLSASLAEAGNSVAALSIRSQTPIAQIGGLLSGSLIGELSESSNVKTPTAPVVFNIRQQKNQAVDAALQQFARANVLYLGEIHDRPEDHRAQLDIIRALHRQRPQLAIAMEMFQRPAQPLLDQYLSGKMTEAELVERSQYQKRWGYDWEFYAPVLRFAKANNLAVIALNTPTEVTRKVARQGFDSLTGEERQWIPPQSEIVLGSESYRQRIQTFYTEIHQGKSKSADFERFFLAQVLWDETMAEQVANWVKKDPNALVIVLAGQGHIAYGDGIPSRVQRRLSALKKFVQLSVLLNPAEPKTDATIADFFWYSP
jgi:uncharacterized iron-regulated protein